MKPNPPEVRYRIIIERAKERRKAKRPWVRFMKFCRRLVGNG